MKKPTRAKQLGIDDAEYERMLEEQSGICAICDKPPKVRRLNVDHDHRTGKVRQLLCHACNRGLGFFRDNADNLERAAAYLRRHREA